MKNGTAALAVRIKSEININVLSLIIWLRIFLFRHAQESANPKTASASAALHKPEEPNKSSITETFIWSWLR